MIPREEEKNFPRLGLYTQFLPTHMTCQFIAPLLYPLSLSLKLTRCLLIKVYFTPTCSVKFASVELLKQNGLNEIGLNFLRQI